MLKFDPRIWGPDIKSTPDLGEIWGFHSNPGHTSLVRGNLRCFLGCETKSPIMEESVRSVKEFYDLMDRLKAQGKDPSKLELILICGKHRGSDEYQSIKCLAELNYGKKL